MARLSCVLLLFGLVSLVCEEQPPQVLQIHGHTFDEKTGKIDPMFPSKHFFERDELRKEHPDARQIALETVHTVLGNQLLHLWVHLHSLPPELCKKPSKDELVKEAEEAIVEPEPNPAPGPGPAPGSTGGGGGGDSGPSGGPGDGPGSGPSGEPGQEPGSGPSGGPADGPGSGPSGEPGHEPGSGPGPNGDDPAEKDEFELWKKLTMKFNNKGDPKHEEAKKFLCEEPTDLVKCCKEYFVYINIKAPSVKLSERYKLIDALPEALKNSPDDHEKAWAKAVEQSKQEGNAAEATHPGDSSKEEGQADNANKAGASQDDKTEESQVAPNSARKKEDDNTEESQDALNSARKDSGKDTGKGDSDEAVNMREDMTNERFTERPSRR